MLHLILLYRKSPCLPGRRVCHHPRCLTALWTSAQHVGLCSISSRTGRSAISRLITGNGNPFQTPVHSFSCEETPDALCFPSSSSQKPLLDFEIVPPVDEMWMTASGLRDCWGREFYGKCHSCLCSDASEGQIRDSDPKCMGALGKATYVTCADREPSAVSEAYGWDSFSLL